MEYIKMVLDTVTAFKKEICMRLGILLVTEGQV